MPVRTLPIVLAAVLALLAQSLWSVSQAGAGNPALQERVAELTAYRAGRANLEQWVPQVLDRSLFPLQCCMRSELVPAANSDLVSLVSSTRYMVCIPPFM